MRPPMRQCGCGLLRGSFTSSGPASAATLRTASRATLPALSRQSARLFTTYYSSRNPTPKSPQLPASQPQQVTPPRQDSTAFRATIDIKHVRGNVDLHAENCRRRNYRALEGNPQRIVDLFNQWQARQRDGRALREQANAVRRQMANAPAAREVEAEEAEESELPEATTDASASPSRQTLLAEAQILKQKLSAIKNDETAITTEMQQLAAALPNLTSEETPDTEEKVLSYINCDDADSVLSRSDRWRSHVHIGNELGILDFSAAGAASGWGWYYLLGDGARLEQALVQYALTTAHRHGWSLVSPPSLVRSHVAAACGFQPRDQGGEQQIYTLEGIPMSLTATAEIPLAALYADKTFSEKGGSPILPIKHTAVSRCYRAEAGARGANTKGLYRVHEFTKVELFAWTAPDLDEATDVFDELVDIQTEILSELGLPCRVLEMPATDLGASAYRKIDIEAFFPSRYKAADSSSSTAAATAAAAAKNSGWGEVTSTSICTDYQTRRLSTRAQIGGSATFPWTLNGTALAVPRVLAAILENGWDDDSMTVAIPECLRPWMDGQETIGRKHRLR